MTIRDHSHDPEKIAQRLQDGPKASYLREWVYGGIDGVVTTFATVAASIGANLSPFTVIILGLANVVGDGFSMAAASYSGAKADSDNYQRLHAQESRHIRKYPEGEREETRQLLAAKGYAGDDLEKMVEIIARDHNHWIDFMLAEEYGVSKPLKTPFEVAVHTFSAFALCGLTPLISFLFHLPIAGPLSLLLSGLTFFAIGSFKSRWSVKSWWREGSETLAIGMTAAALAYGIGFGLNTFMD